MLKRETIAELREARDFCLFFDPSGARGAELAGHLSRRVRKKQEAAADAGDPMLDAC